MKKTFNPKLRSRAALDLASMLGALLSRGLLVDFHYGDESYASAQVYFEEGPTMRRVHAGSFSLHISGLCAGSHEYHNVRGVCVPIAIELWGPSFKRFEALDVPENKPEATRVVFERVKVEQERRREYARTMEEGGGT